MQSNLTSYLKALSVNSSTRIIGDREEYGIEYKLYGISDKEILYDEKLVNKFELTKQEAQDLKENKCVIMSETENGDMEFMFYNDIEEAGRELEDISFDLESYYEEESETFMNEDYLKESENYHD